MPLAATPGNTDFTHFGSFSYVFRNAVFPAFTADLILLYVAFDLALITFIAALTASRIAHGHARSGALATSDAVPTVPTVRIDSLT